MQYPEYRYIDLMSEQETETEGNPFREAGEDREVVREEASRTLPILALNEVFIGESLSSRVSYLELEVDQQQPFKTRNSGLCVATGTGLHPSETKGEAFLSPCLHAGSTSWIFNVNKLTHHAVESLLKITFETTRFPLNWKDHKLVESITSKFNNQLVSPC